MAKNPPPEENDQKLQIKMDNKVGTKGTLVSLLEKAKDTIALVAPKFMTPEKIVKMVLIAASKNPKLFECTNASILQATMTAAECGLDCSGALQEGYLVPFYNSKIKAFEAQFIPGYPGYIKLMCQHESVIFVESRIVYEDDYFVMNYGDERPISHKPELRPKRKQVVMGAYAIVHMVGGHQLCEWMNLSELIEIRDGVLSKIKEEYRKYSPWVTHEAAMMRKSTICRVQKYAPKTPEMAPLMSIDNDTQKIANEISSMVAETLTLPASSDDNDDKNSSLIKKLGGPKDEDEEEPEGLTDEEKALRDRYNAMCGDPSYTDIAEVKNELAKLEGGDFTEVDALTVALDCIEDIKLKHDKASGKKAGGKGKADF